jgi:hypothetical protein
MLPGHVSTLSMNVQLRSACPLMLCLQHHIPLHLTRTSRVDLVNILQKVVARDITCIAKTIVNYK